MNNELATLLSHCIQQSQFAKFETELAKAKPEDAEGIIKNLMGESTGFSLVHHCAHEFGGLKYLQALLQKFPTLNVSLPATDSSFRRQPAVVIAAALGNFETVKLLITHGAVFDSSIQKTCLQKVKKFFGGDDAEEFKEMIQELQHQLKAAKVNKTKKPASPKPGP